MFMLQPAFGSYELIGPFFRICLLRQGHTLISA
jgi:hypothetical protein